MTPHRYQLLAATTAAAALLAGCGGSNSLSTSNSPSADGQLSPAQFQQAALEFTTCMRSHGVPDMPDPGSPGWKLALGSQAPAVVAAEHTCGRLVPGVGPQSQSESQAQSPRRTAAMLAFARCIRTHGFPTFPDPTSTGQLTHAMVAAAGISLTQPGLLEAGDACVSVTHGVITKAVVARFVAGQ